VTGQQGTGWRVTATTVNCPSVTDFATILVRPEGTAVCSWVNRRGQTRDGRSGPGPCRWPDCPLVAEFVQSALAM
jgi:hypothetical protein